MFERQENDCDAARLFARARADLAELRPDLIGIFDTDHCNTFFLDISRSLCTTVSGIDRPFD